MASAASVVIVKAKKSKMITVFGPRLLQIVTTVMNAPKWQGVVEEEQQRMTACVSVVPADDMDDDGAVEEKSHYSEKRVGGGAVK